MKVAVVGGGFSGAMAALALARAGHAVTIYEADAQLGGIVRDVKLPHGRFLRGCHYMNLAPSLQSLWPHIDGLQLHRFDHHYGSWSNLFGTVQVHHDFAQPVVPGPVGAALARCSPDQLWCGSVADYLSVFEPRVAQTLTQWAARVGNVHTLAACNVVPIQISRVFYADDVDSVRTLKQSDRLLDQTLGLPRSLFAQPVAVQSGALPVGGFDTYMQQLQATLERLGVRILTNAPIKPLKGADGRCEISLRGQPQPTDWVVWCANPTPLLAVMAGERLQSPVTPCVYLYASVQGQMPETPVYYQTFSQDHPLLRIFSYDLDGQKITVEALDEGWSTQALVDATQTVMNDLGWDAHITAAQAVPEKRYALVSAHDLACIERFSAQANPMGVITGGWQHYGRDTRLGNILGQLQTTCLL